MMYWQQCFNRKNTDKQIEEEMIKIHQEHTDYGYRWMNQDLRHCKILVNKKGSTFNEKNRNPSSLIYTEIPEIQFAQRCCWKSAENLIHRSFYISIGHQKMTTDITGFKYYEKGDSCSLRIKKLYLNTLMDMYNSEISSYTIWEKPTAYKIMTSLKDKIALIKECSIQIKDGDTK